jgi:hypothetical protein
MFEPAKIADKKYYGCSTPRSVSNFCNRYNVNRFWWRPPDGNKRIMMIDWQNFRDSYKEVYGTFRTTKNWPSPRVRTTKGRTSYSFRRKTSPTRKTRTYRTRRAA